MLQFSILLLKFVFAMPDYARRTQTGQKKSQ